MSTPFISSSPSDPRPETSKTKSDYQELDVFDAENYFKGALKLDPNPVSFHNPKQDAAADEVSVEDQSSVSRSSRNSRSTLLHTRSKPSYTEKFIAAIGSNCCCTHKNSVEVDDPVPGNSKSNSAIRLVTVMKQADRNGDHLVGKLMTVKFEEPELGNSDAHFSFPVFSPFPGDAARRRSLNSWSPVPENHSNHHQDIIKLPPFSTDDSDSDASSDLFEIESFTKGSNNNNHDLPRSENEWSAATSSAADFSVMSLDTEELSSKSSTKTETNSKTPRLLPITLSGCRSHRSIGVIEDAHRANDPKISKQQKSSNEESKLKIFYSRDLPESCYAKILSQTR